MATFPSVTGLVLRLKADDITGLSDGDPIATWSDLSAESNDATAAGSARPTYRASGGPNNSAYVEFDGVANRMSCGTPASLQVSNFSIYLVTSVTAGNPTFERQVTWSAGARSGSHGIGYGLFVTDSSVVVAKGENDLSESQVSVGRAFTGYGVWTWSEGHYTNAGNMDVADRDTNSNSAAPGASGIDYTDIVDFHIGGFNNGTNYFFEGNIVEIVVCDTEQSTGEKAALATYFEDEYFPGTSTRAMGLSIDKETGTRTYVSYLEGTNLIVENHATTTFAVNQKTTLATATNAQVEARTYFVNVFAPSFPSVSGYGNYVYAYGRWDDGTVKHLALSTDGGATFTSIGDSWGADWVSEVFATDPNTIYAFVAGTTKRLYRTQDGGTSWDTLSTLPFDVARSSLSGEGKLAICNRDSDAYQIALADGPLFASWSNITGDVATNGKGAIVWL